MYHPNIYSDGNVCISILHEGVDQYGYESVSERWNPSHSKYSINEYNFNARISQLHSPANVDASKEWSNSEEKL